MVNWVTSRETVLRKARGKAKMEAAGAKAKMVAAGARVLAEKDFQAKDLAKAWVKKAKGRGMRMAKDIRVLVGDAAKLGTKSASAQ